MRHTKSQPGTQGVIWSETKCSAHPTCYGTGNKISYCQLVNYRPNFAVNLSMQMIATDQIEAGPKGKNMPANSFWHVHR